MNSVTITTGRYDHNSGMTYGQWYQTVEKPRLAAITTEQREINANSHMIGNVDDCARCINCEIGAWNAWQQECAR